MTPPYCDRCSADLEDGGCEHDFCTDCAGHCPDCYIAAEDARADLDRLYALENR